MTHGLSTETEKAGGMYLARQSAEEWHTELHKGTIRQQDLKYILWDWQNERVELLEKIKELEKENDQLVELGDLLKEKHNKLVCGVYNIATGRKE